MVLPPVVIRQPRPHDIVDDPIVVCGLGTGFEARFGARVRDARGNELNKITFRSGAMGLWSNFEVQIDLPSTLETGIGSLEVWASSGTGDPGGLVRIPIVFGTALVAAYTGFAQYVVQEGDTLRSIAEQFYGERDKSNLILQANNNQISNPNQIFEGQVLRIAMSSL